jgi:hypothetical protein
MKKPFLLLLLALFSMDIYAKKTKLLLAEKVKYEAVGAKENQKNDQELKEDMTTFLGFGLRLSLKGVEETVKEESNQKKKSALRLQVGFQMPKYIKTQPPQKFFKVGWDLGILQ